MNLTDLDRMYAEALEAARMAVMYEPHDMTAAEEGAKAAIGVLAARIRELEARCAEQEAKIEAARAIIERVDGQCEERIREAQEVYMKILEGHDP